MVWVSGSGVMVQVSYYEFHDIMVQILNLVSWFGCHVISIKIRQMVRVSRVLWSGYQDVVSWFYCRNTYHEYVLWFEYLEWYGPSSRSGIMVQVSWSKYQNTRIMIWVSSCVEYEDPSVRSWYQDWIQGTSIGYVDRVSWPISIKY